MGVRVQKSSNRYKEFYFRLNVSIFYKVFYKLFYKIAENIPAFSKLLFLFNLLLTGKRKQDILILATITKTGTHYLRFLISYYLILYDIQKKGGDIDDIQPDHFLIDKALPNSWHSSYRFFSKKEKPTENLSIIGLFDIPRSHMALRLLEWKGFKVIHTYRNLFDQTVVSYETKYSCDRDLKSEYESVEELHKATFESNRKQYISFSEGSVCEINYLRISFDQIYINPVESLALVIMWLGYEPDLRICQLASRLSLETKSILVGAGEKWQRSLPTNIDQDVLYDFINRYENTGAISVYKDYFSSSFLEKYQNF